MSTEPPTDPAIWRPSHLLERRHARLKIAFGVTVIAATTGALVLLLLAGKHSVDVLVTLGVPLGYTLGVYKLVSGLRAHAVASYKLLVLQKRSNLPPARLVEKSD